MTCPPAGVDWDSAGYGVPNLDSRRFGIVNAHSGAGIRLESLVSRRESQDEVRHEGSRIDPHGHVALCYKVTKAIPQSEVSATAKAIVEEVAFNRWTKYARPKDVTEFNAAEKADIILRRDRQLEIPIKSLESVTRKRSVVTAVLKDIGPRIDRSVETEPIHWRRWWRDVFVFNGRTRLKRRGQKPCQSNSRE